MRTVFTLSLAFLASFARADSWGLPEPSAFASPNGNFILWANQPPSRSSSGGLDGLWNIAHQGHFACFSRFLSLRLGIL